MRIILSRKGVDSGAGGFASPILNGSLIPLTIPTEKPADSQIRYADLKFPGVNIGKLVEDLSKGRYTGKKEIHLDPDLRKGTYQRKSGWRPIFGQGERNSEAHLKNCGVTVGDLFLFFGWFRDVERYNGRYQYKKDGQTIHSIYGWLQVGAIVPCDDPVLSRNAFPWAAYHPHFRIGDGTAYIASKTLNLGREQSEIDGAGVFAKYSNDLRLTDPDSNHRTRWRMPAWCYPYNDCFPFTYNNNKASYRKRGSHCYMKAAARGQEFVLDSCEYPMAVNWARQKIINDIAGNTISEHD